MRGVASLLGAAAKAELKGALAEQLQTALDSLGADRAGQWRLMERERLNEQEAFTHLRRAARSSGRKLSEVAAEIAAGQALPKGRARPARAKPEQPDGEAGTAQADA
jgi:AmiR/NasT family two-component response regulator